MAARQIADAEPTHERGDDERDRVHVCAGKHHQQTLPDDLVEEGGEARGEKDAAGDKNHGGGNAFGV